MYKITIEKVIENPEYEEQLKQYKAIVDTPYPRPGLIEHPIKEIYLKSLVVDLTDEEFKVIKKAVLEVM